jgi:hypothetical protein
MRTHVEFRSDKFPTYATEEEGVNYESGIYGKRLAEFLKVKLSQKGIVAASMNDEDWGWRIDVLHDGNRMRSLSGI